VHSVVVCFVQFFARIAVNNFNALLATLFIYFLFPKVVIFYIFSITEIV